jgi:hypothetical protein
MPGPDPTPGSYGGVSFWSNPKTIVLIVAIVALIGIIVYLRMP